MNEAAQRPPFGKACFGRSAKGRCSVRPSWVTTQERGENPIYACGRHLGWLAALRTGPGYSLTVTRLATPASAEGRDHE